MPLPGSSDTWYLNQLYSHTLLRNTLYSACAIIHVQYHVLGTWYKTAHVAYVTINNK